jgi:hypothetical protein
MSASLLWRRGMNQNDVSSERVLKEGCNGIQFNAAQGNDGFSRVWTMRQVGNASGIETFSSKL